MTKPRLLFPLAITAFFWMTGCERDLTLRTPLAESERVKVNAPVLVDGAPAGFVREVRVEAGRRTAILAVTDRKMAAEKLKAGTVRIVKNGEIQLRTDAVEADAPALVAGSTIPVQSEARLTVKRFQNQVQGRMLLVIAVGLGAALIIWLVLRSLFRLGIALVSLALALLTGLVLYRHLTPQIERLYATAPDASLVSDSNSDLPSATPDEFQAVKTWELKIIYALERYRLDPRVAAFIAIAVPAFVLFAIVLGGAMRSLRRNR